MNHVIQNVLMPHLAFGASEMMYVRLSNDKVHALMSENRLLFDAGGRASFDTFFNSVTVGAWKSHSHIASLQLHLRGHGKFIVRVGLHRIGQAHRWLSEKVLSLDPEEDQVIEVEAWSTLDSGMLYFALEALEPGSLTAGHFATRTAPQRNVKLGIVITHFNRKAYVLPAIRRIREELLSDPCYRGRIELIVVDNSQNITAEEAEGVTLIPNRNLGGSGGFTRGLLHLKDQTDFTHCLFMDDDASCETESIRRAYALLAYFKDPALTLSGSLMRELEPNRLFEKGARFTKAMCQSLKSGLNMNQVDDLLRAEVEDEKPMYGAWWFFAFPLSAFSVYPFPFFVRGDDIRFGLDNKFKIMTINGVGCWGDDFSLKSGPLPLYLDVRNHVIAMLTVCKAGPLRLFKVVSHFVMGQLFSYNYAAARACILALENVMEGPEFFKKNIDMGDIRQKVQSYQPSEKLEKISKTDYEFVPPASRDTRVRQLLRWALLNGFLLPTCLLRKGLVLQGKSFRAPLREVFGGQGIYYEYVPSGMAYVAYHDKKEFFSLLLRYVFVMAALLFSYRKLSSIYRETWPAMTSENFWREVFEI
jgi:galactofuranosylgalactofuranosylrhamnosyl-N-acetylglucosaminyl-diphospho-decaprenol beta-1,5/1,6-galactofuranosyltransferase